MTPDRLADGRTLVLGFGREARALEALVLRRWPGADVTVVCEQAPERGPLRWPLTVASLDQPLPPADRVLRSPGVAPDRAGLAPLSAAGVPITCISSLWFCARPDAHVVAVTGSKGKSTTAALINHLLNAAGMNAILAGNIGVPVLEHLETRADWFVIELSSYQLVDLIGHAEIGVITRLFPEHQDWHRGVEPYYQAKFRLVELLAGRPLWINAGDPVLAARAAAVPGVIGVNNGSAWRADRGGVWRSGKRVVEAGAVPLPGPHNLDNLALACAVVEHIVGDRLGAVLTDAVARFRALDHRLQPVSERNGRRWINDSIATSPNATLAALESIAEPVVLIVGGHERNADWAQVIEFARRKAPVAVIGLPANGARIVAEFQRAGVVSGDQIVTVDSIEQAVTLAAGLCPEPGCVLLSPGAPSFGQFRDFEQRGRRFIEAVRALPR